MAYKNLQNFISHLEANGELVRVKARVSPNLEISEITDRVSKSGGKALLFENTGKEFPVLINSLGSERRICMALGVSSLDEIGKEMEKMFMQFTTPATTIMDKLRMLPKLRELSQFIPRVKKGRGDCQKIIMQTPDLYKLPILKCWPYDGGLFITLPVVHTKDPETGNRNQGMYRMQIFEKDLTALHWHLHKGAGYHFDKHHSKGTRMPVAVTLGGDPVYSYVATAPLPDNIDEYILAGFLRKKPVNLVKCITNNLEVPEDADIVIEGYIYPDEEDILEGPFGDHTGYYSLEDFYPRFHVSCITHRADAIYPTTIVGIPPQEDTYLGKATERIFLTPMKMSVSPEIVDIHMPAEGVFHNIVIVKIKKKYQGQGIKVMNALWGAGQMMFNKIMIVVDENVDIFSYLEVAYSISENVNPLNDIIFSKGPLDVLDHSSSSFAFGSKMGIDATVKNIEELGNDIILENDFFIDKDKIFQIYPEVKAINDTFLRKNLPFLLISIEKSKPNHINSLHDELIKSGLIRNVRFIIYLEHIIDIYDLGNVVWRFANNFEPQRDSIFVSNSDGVKNCEVGFDGTRKTKELDGFSRPWPNIIVMDDKTIKDVDEKWDILGLGDFIPSPSLKYKSQSYKGGAVSE